MLASTSPPPLERSRLAAVRVVAFDIDGTLTDGTTHWLGAELGWSQTYSTRDGEAILWMVRAGITVLPLSRNPSRTARVRMEALKLPLDWLGVSDKVKAIDELIERHGGDASALLFVGDGREDAEVFARVGVACAVHDAHPVARGAAHWVLERSGGGRVMEEIALAIEAARAG